MPQYFKTVSVILAVTALTFMPGGISPSQVKKAQAYADGALIKAANDPNIYIINNNLKVWVRSIEVFNTCGYDWNNLNNVSSLDEVPTADLIKKADNPDVFRLQKNFKRKLASIEIFESYGLDWNKIAAVCPAVLDSYSRAPLVQLQGSSNIYRVDADFIRHHYPTWASFVNDGKQTRDVIEINALEFSSYAEGAAMGETNGQGGQDDGQTNLPAASVLTDPGVSAASGASLTLNWSTVANAASYVLEQDTDSSFTNPTTIYSGAGTSYSHSLTPASTTTYYWRVQARNNIGHSPWSNVVDLKVTVGCDLPGVPTLTVPADSVITNLPYNVSWTTVAGAASYALEWASDSAFSATLVIYSGANISYPQNPKPTATSTYYYRVRSSNSCGNSAWSNTASIVVSTSAPQAPVLTDPGVSVSANVHFNLSWSGVSGATSYTLDIANVVDFTAVLSEQNIGNVTSYDCSHSGLGTYYYRVKASNASGDSVWSNVVDMQVEPPVPEAPVLIDPGESVESGVGYTVSWNAVANAASYSLEEATDSSFSNPAIFNFNAVSYSFTGYQPLNDTTYYYRVRARNNQGFSSWSNIVDILIKGPLRVPQQYQTLQAAINAAANGNIIMLSDGTYTENITINKSVTIQSQNGAAVTTISAANSGTDVFRISADNVTVKGITVSGATGYKSGFYLTGADNCHLSDNVVTNNWYGIWLDYAANNVLNNNTVKSNSSVGIMLYQSSNGNTISNSEVFSNGNTGIQIRSVQHGGSGASDNNVVRNCQIHDNTGVGIDIYGSKNNEVDSCVIRVNGPGTFNVGGLLLSDYSTDNLIRNTEISQNRGNGINLGSATSGNTIKTSDIASNTGYGIKSWDSNNNKIYRNNFRNNTSGTASLSNTNNIWSSPDQITYTYQGQTKTNYLGNYWSGYSGADTNGDGVGETAYSFSGKQDNYPLVQLKSNYN